MKKKIKKKEDFNPVYNLLVATAGNNTKDLSCGAPNNKSRQVANSSSSTSTSTSNSTSDEDFATLAGE